MQNFFSAETLKAIKALPIADDCERVQLKPTHFSSSENALNAERSIKTQKPVWPFYSVRKGVKAASHDGCQLGRLFGYAHRSTTMLPCYATFVATGNPYPENANVDANIASKGYAYNRTFTTVHHAIFEKMKDGNAYSAQDFLSDYDGFIKPLADKAATDFKIKAVKFNNNHKNGNEFSHSVLHALQELEACNSLIVPQAGTRNVNSKFVMQPALVSAYAPSE